VNNEKSIQKIKDGLTYIFDISGSDNGIEGLHKNLGGTLYPSPVFCKSESL